MRDLPPGCVGSPQCMQGIAGGREPTSRPVIVVATMTQSTTKLLSTVAFAALASIALPASAQEAPATPDQPTAVIAQPVAPPPVTLPSIASAPAPQAEIQPAPVTASGVDTAPTVRATLPVPKLDAPPISTVKAAPIAATRPSTTKSTITTTAPAQSPAATTQTVANPRVANAPITNESVANDIAATRPITQAPAIADAPADPVTTTVKTPAGDRIDWALMAGLAGGIAALGLAAVVITRRRRDRTIEEAPVADTSRTWADRDTAPLFAAEPAADHPAMAPVAAPVAAPVSVGTGDHVAAAMRGPSPDNPFLTQRARLRRARFLEKQAANRASEPRPAIATEAAQTVPIKVPAKAPEFQTTYVVAKGKPSGLGFGLRPSRS